MDTNQTEVQGLVYDTDLYKMLPEKGYQLDDLFYKIAADINTHHVSAMGVHYEGKKRLQWLIGRVHYELKQYCPQDKWVELDKILASAGF